MALAELGTSPILPPELEELIFSFAVQGDLKGAGRFCLVAKRVHEWMLPHIYEIMVLDCATNSIPHAEISLADLSRYGKYVRHLLVQNLPTPNQHELGVHIGRCTNLVSLALWIGSHQYSSTIVESLLQLRLKYLSIDINALVRSLGKEGHASPIPFPSVTHIEHIGFSEIDPHQVEEYFPAQTHISITSLCRWELDLLRRIVKIFERQLKVIVWYPLPLIGAVDEPVVDPALDPQGSDDIDPRIVEMTYGRSLIGTWYQGVKGGLGIWRVAEEAVEARYRALGTTGRLETSG